MKVLDLKHIFHKELNTIYSTDEVSSLFYLSIEQVLGISRIQVNLEPELTITKDTYDTIFSVLDALKNEKPIQYIFGEADFFGLKFNVNKDVLIPRQETEELIYWVIKSNTKTDKLHILDIGTGSGCIAITLAKNFPKSKVYAIDVSEEALKVAQSNADLNNVNVTFINTDVLDFNKTKKVLDKMEFDIIISNPPYVRQIEKVEIKPNVLDYEPHLALFVKDDNPLVFYKAIAKLASEILKEKGQLYFEINQYLGEETKNVLSKTEFQKVELRKDLNGNFRMLKGLKK